MLPFGAALGALTCFATFLFFGALGDLEASGAFVLVISGAFEVLGNLVVFFVALGDLVISGVLLGFEDGSSVIFCKDGLEVGVLLGFEDGSSVIFCKDGLEVGFELGDNDGSIVVRFIGFISIVGNEEGDTEGEGVGSSVTP